MEFIDMEATKDSQEIQPLVFSDDNEEINDAINSFIDDSEQPREDISFYRKFDPNNLNHYHKFSNQTIDPRIPTYKNNQSYFGAEDQQPELYGPENRDTIEFDKFSGFEKSVKKFKKKKKKILRTVIILFLILLFMVLCITRLREKYLTRIRRKMF